MDPLTQGLLGGVAAQSFKKKNVPLSVSVIGFLGGLAADADVFIKYGSDPLYSWLNHRGFSHSIFFIPLGGLAVGLICWFLLQLILRKKIDKKPILIAATIGYATHGLLDACTSYGTYFFWPLSDTRTAFKIISIIDPVYSLILFFGFMACLIKKIPRPAQTAFFLTCLYLLLGTIQQFRAQSFQKEIALSRGHIIERGRVDTTLINNLVWRSVYELNGQIYIDALRLIPFATKKYISGGSIESFKPDSLDASISRDSLQYKDILRFSHFSDAYIARIPENNNAIGDIRYGQTPSSSKPIWGIIINPKDWNAHPSRINMRTGLDKYRSELKELLLGSKGQSLD